MTIKVVVLDAAQLPAGVEFPPLETAQYGWEQYPGLAGDEIAERCWRADIVVSLSTAIDRTNLEKMQRLKLLVCAAQSCQQLDQGAARQQGVELLAFPEARFGRADEAQDLCQRISQAIDHYIRNFENKELPS